MPDFLFSNDSLTDEIIAGVVVAILLALAVQITRLLSRAWRRTTAFFGARRLLRRLDREIVRAKTRGRWVRPVAAVDRKLQQRIATSKPILLIGNQKGGVGKTTLAANLGAYFAAYHAKRVLFVDLDFQGSLSFTMRAMATTETQDDPDALVGEILTADYRAARRGRGARDAAASLLDRRRRFRSFPVHNRPGDLQYSGFFDAGSELAQIEDWLMLRWVTLRERSDSRFQLARFLHHPEVQQAFDIAILDAPPRNTTAGVNGLCAATHILTPTRADDFSWRGAERYLVEASLLVEQLNPQVRFLGFVGTMTAQALPTGQAPDGIAHRLEAVQRQTLRTLATRTEKPLLAFWPVGSSLDYLGTIPTRQAVAEDAGSNITYITTADFRPLVEAVGEPLWRRMFPEDRDAGRAG